MVNGEYFNGEWCRLKYSPFTIKIFTIKKITVLLEVHHRQTYLLFENCI